MPNFTTQPAQDFDEDAPLRIILEGTAAETGKRFFPGFGEKISAKCSRYTARLPAQPKSVPPLRERDDDNILLASAFVEKYTRRMERRANYITPQQIARLKSYNWPGNVRELQNVIERANILRALKAADWKVSGENGAAHLLDLPPSTLSSRMKALGIRRPRN